MNKLICRYSLLLLLAGVPMASVPGLAEDSNEQLRDPTRPLSYRTAKRAEPQLVLQAILQRNSSREAIVSGHRVRVGSTVEGARIDKINEQEIVYSYQGKSRTLHLRPRILTR